MLIADAKDFLKSEKVGAHPPRLRFMLPVGSSSYKWYADRGIPFRRGYLLYGVPGSGKSSLIHALAGELMLDIYVVSLSSSWINDSTLTTLMGRVPSRCIVLLEDLDAAFTRSVSRAKDKEKDKDKKKSDSKSDNEDESTSSSSSRSRRSRNKENLSDVNTLTLSGLLNALDGVAAAEGRILTFFLRMCRNSRLNYPADYSSTAQQITLINWTLLSVVPAAWTSGSSLRMRRSTRPRTYSATSSHLQMWTLH